MKKTPEYHKALSGSTGNSPSRPLHQWILAALLANAVLLCVIALQIKQVGHQITCLANQDRIPVSEPYAYARMPASEHPYSVSFAKNENYSAYRVSNSDPIPVRVVNTPLTVGVKNDLWNPILVEIKK